MGTLNPRPRGSRNLATNAKGDRNDREQIRRLLNARTVPPASDSVVGTTRCTAGSLEQSNNVVTNQSGIQGADWTFTELGGVAPSITDAGSGFLAPDEDGLYLFSALHNVSWSSSAVPPVVTVSADYEGSPGSTVYPIWRRSPDFLYAVREQFTWGAWYLTAGTGVLFSTVWLTADPCFLDDLVVDITRLA